MFHPSRLRVYNRLVVQGNRTEHLECQFERSQSTLIQVDPSGTLREANADPPTDPDAGGSVADSLDADGRPLVNSVVQSSDATPFKDLDQAPFLKRVRFAPIILSVVAPSSAPHCRMLAPCSDICHPIKFRRSNLGNLAFEDVPVDDGPNPRADIEYHDLSIPPSDGVTLEMEPESVIDLNLTPSPISRISKKYSMVASIFEEPFSSSSVGSTDRAKKKTLSRIKPCKSK
ncbi:hypothetical protein Nepgr_016414 [Nepenthes gracilis]|uniref:Uncharacterized protein n=1 Tax=Nepenthes gracilis TaxID=150966 RepID=A0AAD3SNH6_NEPGR|nr:hypothetical protein Nepgr_016414 [Nepenthes gracilis]